MERWFFLFVTNHKDVSSLVDNVLLYDRLMMPV